MTIHPRDSGTLGWVVIQKHPDGCPKMGVAASRELDEITAFFYSAKGAEAYLQTVPGDLQRLFQVHPVLLYLAVGDTGNGVFDEKGNRT